ncbi:hypothetical protein BD560DRAFT_381793 [Blakeslea trispora]|nr:hypothetical protein BD560DRAFT_381793 [Blakeslea trispora]
MKVTTHKKITPKGKKPYKSWLKDGVHGGPCSMNVLIDWLSYRPNYKRWKREDFSIDRVPKKDLLEEIIDNLRQVGIYHRLSKDVASKISTLQSNYRITRKWLDAEGYKLRFQPEGDRHLHDELIKRFPYWDTLDPVFSSYNNEIDSQSSPSHHHTSPMAITSLVLPPTPTDEKDEPCFQKRPFYMQNIKENVQQKNDFILSLGQPREMEIMQKSQDMLYYLQQKQDVTQERLLVQHEKHRVQEEFMKCLYKAGFTQNEVTRYAQP